MDHLPWMCVSVCAEEMWWKYTNKRDECQEYNEHREWRKIRLGRATRNSCGNWFREYSVYKPLVRLFLLHGRKWQTYTRIARGTLTACTMRFGLAWFRCGAAKTFSGPGKVGLNWLQRERHYTIIISSSSSSNASESIHLSPPYYV